MNTLKDCPKYYRVAREAVRLEQQNQYNKAAKRWQKASLLAIDPRTVEWCHHRIAFCIAQHARNEAMK